jgi:hypothetical protein
MTDGTDRPTGVKRQTLALLATLSPEEREELESFLAWARALPPETLAEILAEVDAKAEQEADDAAVAALRARCPHLPADPAEWDRWPL